MRENEGFGSAETVHLPYPEGVRAMWNRRVLESALVEHLTIPELAALARFYATPGGASALRKMLAVNAAVTPALTAELVAWASCLSTMDSSLRLSITLDSAEKTHRIWGGDLWVWGGRETGEGRLLDSLVIDRHRCVRVVADHRGGECRVSCRVRWLQLLTSSSQASTKLKDRRFNLLWPRQSTCCGCGVGRTDTG